MSSTIGREDNMAQTPEEKYPREEFTLDGVEVHKLINRLSQREINKIRLFLEYFPRYKELTDYFRRYRKMIEDRHVYYQKTVGEQSARIRKERNKKRKIVQRRNKESVIEPKKLTTVVGICKRCGSELVGFPIPRCERKKSGRIFYKECSQCSYYSEIIRKGENFKEVEGG